MAISRTIEVIPCRRKQSGHSRPRRRCPAIVPFGERGTARASGAAVLGTRTGPALYCGMKARRRDDVLLALLQCHTYGASAMTVPAGTGSAMGASVVGGASPHCWCHATYAAEVVGPVPDASRGGRR